MGVEMDTALYRERAGKPGSRRLAHVPGDQGQLVIGHTAAILSDPYAFARDMFERYGKVFRVHFLSRQYVWLVGPEATQYVLIDRDKNLSSTLGWDNRLGRLFHGGLMLM